MNSIAPSDIMGDCRTTSAPPPPKVLRRNGNGLAMADFANSLLDLDRLNDERVEQLAAKIDAAIERRRVKLRKVHR